MRAIRSLAVAAVMSVFSVAVAAAVDTVDRGPLPGTGEGRIWSRVVDQVGNTQGQAEVWHLGPARPDVRLRVTLEAPIAEQISTRVHLMTTDGGLVEFEVADPQYRTPNGFSAVIGPFKRPDLNPDLRVVLYPRKPSMDQTYRLSAAWEGGDAAPAEAVGEAADWLGIWRRSEGGTIVEMIEIQTDGTGFVLIFRDAEGQETSRLAAVLVDGVLTARGTKRLVSIVLGEGVLQYTSTDFDGSNRWDGAFLR